MAQHVFIIGSRGLPAQYGGFETFVEQLVKHQISSDIKYHVACMSQDKHEVHFDYLGADCFTVKVPEIGGARVIAYDSRAMKLAIKQVELEGIDQPIFYILGNTIGGFIWHFVRQIHKKKGRLFVNPDGLEWRRTKWSKPVRKYLKYAERKMVEHSDLIISDNEGILDYLQSEYDNVNSKVITYGTDTDVEVSSNSPTLDKFNVKDYYLIVGRFVPENNYELIIREFMKSVTSKNLVIVTNYEENSFYDQLRLKTGFDSDSRIKFVGTVYDQKELRYIRKNAFAYLHGHEVGGTNPSLLEAMWSTPVNVVLDVNFNKKTAQKSVIYFDKNNLKDVLINVESLTAKERKELHDKAQKLIKENYTWELIGFQYEELFIES